MKFHRGEDDGVIASTRDFKETIRARVRGDAAFREALLKEGVACLLADDEETGRTVFREYIDTSDDSEESGRGA